MKNTRLLYTDEAHIKMYEAMPCEQFKEFMLAVLKYKYGDDSILDTIQDPMVKALFMAEKQHIDFNEKKWAERAEIARNNGAKSKGRPRKDAQSTEEYDDGPYGNLMGYQMEEDWR